MQGAEGDEARALPLLLSGLSGCEVLHADPNATSNDSWYALEQYSWCVQACELVYTAVLCAVLTV